MKGKAFDPLGSKDQVLAKGHRLSGNCNLSPNISARRIPPLLVELAVVRQVALGDYAKNVAAIDDYGTIVETPLPPQGCANYHHRSACLAGASELCNGIFDAVEKRLAEQQVINRIARQAELGEHHECDALEWPSRTRVRTWSIFCDGLAILHRGVQAATRRKP